MFRCHTFVGIRMIRHWISIVRKRWSAVEEVSKFFMLYLNILDYGSWVVDPSVLTVIRLFVHWFNNLFICSVILSSIHSFIHPQISFIHPFIQSFMFSLLIQRFIHSCIHLFVHSFIHPFGSSTDLVSRYSLIHIFIPLFPHPCNQLFIHQHTNSFINSSGNCAEH